MNLIITYNGRKVTQAPSGVRPVRIKMCAKKPLSQNLIVYSDGKYDAAATWKIQRSLRRAHHG